MGAHHTPAGWRPESEPRQHFTKKAIVLAPDESRYKAIVSGIDNSRIEAALISADGEEMRRRTLVSSILPCRSRKIGGCCAADGGDAGDRSMVVDVACVYEQWVAVGVFHATPPRFPSLCRTPRASHSTAFRALTLPTA